MPSPNGSRTRVGTQKGMSQSPRRRFLGFKKPPNPNDRQMTGKCAAAAWLAVSLSLSDSPLLFTYLALAACSLHRTREGYNWMFVEGPCREVGTNLRSYSDRGSVFTGSPSGFTISGRASFFGCQGAEHCEPNGLVFTSARNSWRPLNRPVNEPSLPPNDWPSFSFLFRREFAQTYLESGAWTINRSFVD